MHRFFVRRTGDAAAELLPEEETHALKVLRMNAGDPCQALLEGRVYHARITGVSPRVTVALGEEAPCPEPSVRVTLYQGIPKGDKMDYIVQKGTEAGISRVVPVTFSRCVAQWTDRDAEKKTARLQRIAREAAKQSGRAAVPQIDPPLSLRQLPRLLAAHEAVFVPWEEARGRGVASYLNGQKDLALLIGPEGGISEDEIAFLRSLGAVPVTLGPRIFRTETAGLAALISILTLTGDMGR